MDSVSTTLSSTPKAVTVLVIEDEFMIRLDLSEGLRRLGYTVIEAVNADEGWVVLQSGADIQVVITDQRLPGTLDGAALVRHVRHAFEHIKLIMVSAEAHPRELRGQLDGFFLKPCHPDDIGALLERLGLPAER